MEIKITHETLKALLIIAAKDDIRYYLKSVCVDVTDKGTALVACDGHRLLAVPADDVTDAMPGEYIIPRESIAAIKPCKAGRVTLPLELTITKPAPVPDPARSGVTVLGLDIDTKKVDSLNQGKSYIKHIPSSEVAGFVQSGDFSA